jgi:hypothetical protein
LPFHAVLCVACGYHLKTGVQLATLGGDAPAQTTEALPLSDPKQVASAPRPVDLNPYAPPQTDVPIDHYPEDDQFAADLTVNGERRAKAVVSDAEFVWTIVVFCFLCCWPAWLVELPWYCFRLYCWHRLNREFSELRHPNSLSQHGDLAAKFQEAKPKIWIGIGIGIFGWLVLTTVAAVGNFLP